MRGREPENREAEQISRRTYPIQCQKKTRPYNYLLERWRLVARCDQLPNSKVDRLANGLALQSAQHSGGRNKFFRKRHRARSAMLGSSTVQDEKKQLISLPH
jgi:hypothetical protein